MRKRVRLSITDLTPLLDVIFIILFLILMRSENLVEKRVKNAEDALAQKNEALEDANRKIEDYEAVFKKAIFINIQLEKDGNNRTLVITEGDIKQRVESKGFNPDAIGENVEKLVTDRYDLIDDKTPMFVIFEYNKSETYQSDFVAVSKALEKLQKKKDNLYTQIKEKQE